MEGLWSKGSSPLGCSCNHCTVLRPLDQQETEPPISTSQGQTDHYESKSSVVGFPTGKKNICSFFCSHPSTWRDPRHPTVIVLKINNQYYSNNIILTVKIHKITKPYSINNQLYSSFSIPHLISIFSTISLRFVAMLFSFVVFKIIY